MTKRIIAMTLSALLLSTSLFSCGTSPEEGNLPESVTVASSDAQEYGQWLRDRLVSIPHDVTVGIGSSDKYGVDMTNFEDDGYVIKVNDEDILIFGKTADGLDRGVRKYANTVDMGGVVTDITYHEGYRIEDFRIFGVDISEYVIEYDGATANENMKFAATELQRLVKFACGAELAISETATGAAHKIILRHSTDAELRDDGFRYFAEGANLVIEGAVARGCMYGVYRFLQNECGWEGLANIDSIRQNVGDSHLLEAELVDIPADINEIGVPTVDYVRVHTNSWAPNAGVTDRITPTMAQISGGAIVNAQHGMQGHMWDEQAHTSIHGQACYTNDGNLELILENIVRYIENHIAGGGVVGETLKSIDISQGDNDVYCFCRSCSEVMSKHKSVSSTVVYGANYIAEQLNEMYPTEDGIAVHIFAYLSTKIPPENGLEVNKNVYITYAQNGNCSNHPMDGSGCSGEDEFYYHSTDMVYNEAIGSSLYHYDNVAHAEWLSGWCELSDNVYVWYYALDHVLHQYTILDVIQEDFRYMDELGVKGLFWQNTYHGFGIKRVEHVLGMELIWDIDMSEEEYEAALCRLLEREYGEGWAYVREYIDLWEESMNRLGCCDCWWFASNQFPMHDFKFVMQYGDVMLELIEKAVSLAGSAEQEYRIRLLSCHVYYSYIYSHYFTAYENEDTEMLEKLDAMYLDTIELIKEMGFDITAIISVDGGRAKVYPTLEQEAWLVWEYKREELMGSENLRPAPEVEDIYAEVPAS